MTELEKKIRELNDQKDLLVTEIDYIDSEIIRLESKVQPTNPDLYKLLGLVEGKNSMNQKDFKLSIKNEQFEKLTSNGDLELVYGEVLTIETAFYFSLKQKNKIESYLSELFKFEKVKYIVG